jgi:hypothetical protein
LHYTIMVAIALLPNDCFLCLSFSISTARPRKVPMAVSFLPFALQYYFEGHNPNFRTAIATRVNFPFLSVFLPLHQFWEIAPANRATSVRLIEHDYHPLSWPRPA